MGYKFDMSGLLFDKRKTASELSAELSIPASTIIYSQKRERVSVRLLRRMEARLGNLQKYLTAV